MTNYSPFIETRDYIHHYNNGFTTFVNSKHKIFSDFMPEISHILPIFSIKISPNIPFYRNISVFYL